jgi:uncharacterized membrane protein YdjX (TVP38/TMEM64 family)
MKYAKLIALLAVLTVAWILLSRIELLKSADSLRTYILSWGRAAPLFFIGIQVLQVIVAPIPGQAAGFVGGFVFGWKLGLLYSMTGLALGTWIVLLLARRFGRAFIGKLGVGAAVDDFEKLFRKKDGVVDSVVARSKKALSSNGLLTFFVIMLLPGLPDDLVCFAAGLSGIPIWQLLPAAIFGRLPGMLVLSMAGAGFSTAETNRAFAAAVAACVLLALIYLWKRQQFESWMRRTAGISSPE